MKYALSFLALGIFSVCTAQAPTDGLIGYWPMNGNFNETAGTGLNGTNYNCSATSDVFGTAGNAMNFTNTSFTATQVDQHGFFPLNPALHFALADDFTIDYNVYFTPFSFRFGGGVFDYGINDQWGYGMLAIDSHVSGGNLRLFGYYGSKQFGTTNGSLNYNTWYHITYVKSGSTGKIYINGALNSSSGDFGSASPNYGAVTGGFFGAVHHTNYTPPYYAGLNGKIDEFRIYNRALTDAEIATITQLLLNTSDQTATAKFAFYPNPATDAITLSSDVQSAELYDALGKKMSIKLENNQIDISQLSKGIYMVQLAAENTIIVQKLVKK